MLKFEESASRLINNTYVRQGLESISYRQESLTRLISERRLPLESWDETLITFILHELSSMDSNNFRENIGIGEREGRIYSNMVYRRHFGFSHGIGRSGDIAEVQPKACGSSIISKITSELALHALHLRGLKSLKSCLVVPVATGMSIMLCLTALKTINSTGKFVIWSRIDQKSCFKAILTAGCVPVVVELLQVNDELQTNTIEIERLLLLLGAEVLCVLSTTSCFAPRTPDKVDEIAKICKQYGVAHVINNAYGLQCQYISRLIERAMTVGRVDYIVQSTDKNFLVPVGGALVASPSEAAVRAVAKMYPGRASASPIIDLFVTLLAMGQTGLDRLWREREELLPYFVDQIHAVSQRHQQRVLLCPHNSVSVAISLGNMTVGPLSAEPGAQGPNTAMSPVFFGSMLFKRMVSGTRVVTGSDSNTIGGLPFEGWGAHTAHCTTPYLTAACAVGVTRAEVDLFAKRLDKVFCQYTKQLKQASRPLRPLLPESESAMTLIETSATTTHVPVLELRSPGTVPVTEQQQVTSSNQLELTSSGLEGSEKADTALAAAAIVDTEPNLDPLSKLWLDSYHKRKK